MILAIQIFLIAIAGCAKGCMDTIIFHYDKSIFKKLNPNFWYEPIACNNKYKGGLKENGPRFFLSTTALVFLTSGWHLMQWVFLNSLFLAFSLSSTITEHFYYDFFILRFTLGLFFMLFYDKLLKTKTKP